MIANLIRRIHGGHVFLAYLLAGVLTFGPAYNMEYEPENGLFQHGQNFMRAVFSAAGWPLFWSFEVTKGMRS